MNHRIILSLVFVALVSPGCSSINPHFDPKKSHHTREGFRNNYAVPNSDSRQDKDYSKAVPNQSLAIPDALPLNSNRLKDNRTENTATFLSHATVLIQMSGLNILTDPHFSERASPLSFLGPRRSRPAAASIEQLPKIDVIVISHNHYDHMDIPTLRRFLKQVGGEPLILVPIGNGDAIRNMGAKRVVELDWWQSFNLNGSEIYSVPVHHWSARTLWDKNRALWGGWVFDSKAGRVFFSGDTAYSPDFLDIAKRFPSFDLALIPIGAYAPRSVMRSRHVNPEEAVQIHKDLRSKRSMGIHWGTFDLTDEPTSQPLIDLAIAREAAGIGNSEFFVPRHGEIYTFPR
jgi:N-acyl-phosphatidylethanolamine-hydrolysing phospholipase D